MKTPFKNIYNILKLNRFIVLVTVIGAVLTCMVSVLMVIGLHRESMDNAFVVNGDGSVIPLKMVSQLENLEVEAKAHLELFHRYFYGIDASNYESNLEKALWLGNSSVDALYRQKKAEGVYNRLLQYSLVQKVRSIASKMDLQSEPYRFETVTVFEINRGSVTDTYELTTTGNLIHVDRNFPNNTHGLLITNFFENTLKRIENYESREK
ncbi:MULTISPECIES: conjugal transfer protein TraK [Flavobacteriaceae]|uniref:Conjugal transfer protein TraK n=1 Tax=Maribacter flavus TaxID=1658664 RepID=A0ABU7IKC5_9FLAO|nr:MULTISPECIES: conjugal transfer protein TraK [Flavobacteriaceae]MDC6406298.1 conjugal transfer protein TraK [Maribacter sp. PR66]MEE1973418.1 conjugal transfer protein TraK [Maribacter flavus]NDV17730.1 conjugal transfer protein TraK [Muricauda sp. TY007]USD24665.1 conjugal transfer protein TraK [Allomuricauda aquimarina]